MNKVVSLVIPGGGILLIILGVSATKSFSINHIIRGE